MKESRPQRDSLRVSVLFHPGESHAEKKGEKEERRNAYNNNSDNDDDLC